MHIMFMPQNTALVFPGQGSQHVGMGKEFLESSVTKDLFAQADETLQFRLTELMMNGDEAELTQTENTQPALLAVSYAAFTYLTKQANASVEDMAKFVAGHSLGEYSAALAAGVFDFETALKLVRARGLAMAKAMPEGKGAMAAILGLSFVDVEAICAEAGCFVANDNAEGQVVVSGETSTVLKAMELAKEKGAKRAVQLGVSASFHCPLMTDVADVMTTELAEATVQEAKTDLIYNVTAQAGRKADDTISNLVEQVTGRVRWRESMIFAANEGITTTLELGSGKVLTGLAKRCDSRLKGINLNSPEMIDAYLESLAKQTEEVA